MIHSYYGSREPSGENVVVDSQRRALEAAGHDVALIARRTDEVLQGRLPKLAAAFSVATGHGPSPEALLAEFRPDIVHIHNLFPNWGWRWLREWQGPLIATLHNFRPLCAAGTLFRDGHTCFDCLDRSSVAAIRHACYRGSSLASLPLAWQNRGTPSQRPLLESADRLVALSRRAAKVYREAGLSQYKLTVVPNFVEANEPLREPVSRSAEWLFVGRDSPEKGLTELVSRWPEDVPLGVIGQVGDLAKSVDRDLGFVRVYGRLSQDRVRSAIASSRGLVVPSRWFEGLPTVYLEALSTGTPVLALAGNSAADAVAEESTGVVVSHDDWESGIRAIEDQWVGFSSNATAAFLSKYTEVAWLRAITDVYESVVQQ